jgi:C4-dicarboxylate-specific signal transduction histidine kinase
MFDEKGHFVGYRGVGRHITERKRAEEALRSAQAELAHANRVTTMGQLTASIAHEVSQPIAATLINAQAGLRWLAAQPPNLNEVRQILGQITDDSTRAGEVIGGIRALIKKAPPRKEVLEINEAIREVIALSRSEVVQNGVAVRTQLAEGLPPIQADRVQLQQVILNLIINAVEAMSGASEGARELAQCRRDEIAGPGSERRARPKGGGCACYDRLPLRMAVWVDQRKWPGSFNQLLSSNAQSRANSLQAFASP